MTDHRHQIAQLNIAQMKAPLDHPLMAGFMARLAEINALADASPGFVWRLQTEEGDATAIQAFDDPRLLVNLSVWESIEALHAFVYHGGHLELLRARKDWFDAPGGAHLVLWWVASGALPSLDEAKRRLGLLNERGPGPDAFTFRHRFPPPGADEVEAAGDLTRGPGRSERAVAAAPGSNAPDARRLPPADDA